MTDRERKLNELVQFYNDACSLRAKMKIFQPGLVMNLEQALANAVTALFTIKEGE